MIRQLSGKVLQRQIRFLPSCNNWVTDEKDLQQANKRVASGLQNFKQTLVSRPLSSCFIPSYVYCEVHF